ncbi:L-glutamate gamma-semialdehyde dehydrogenase [Salisediminibacterium halotolerans]|uniref:L-glutamate gamma-semialdehyde dehydrogenase n=1 Tax=Salisediminibacterium halotolerans TaxID=517425 RepID=UPI000EAEDCD1|nr:L-glutamate gamma-semialdehyde dehydrogenase [Salisediminibacterium halotolerans]RLJ73285.1 delta-1-pyrroline-5-carboxylate dehydrogenase [Actinophytocola xinjiangensis]RPE86707.1 delta-1-pyrroline-5-carboxylate dehydrogenase [Salisediminibacterium halotolerans]TWG34082.1 delta-1-pyrroline-5-carboxylate dehydrogenase [Salisediminibacterium halotolerans]GEL07596.1 1-pyrroline-5-carboxylate dehydrogenase [Salisediminibacterium halotolerans]
MVTPYKHEPFTDFSVEENRKAYQDALDYVGTQMGKEYPLIINGEKIFTDKKTTTVNPNNHSQVVGYVSKCDQELAEKAHQSAQEAFKSWSKWDPEARAAILFRAAAKIRHRKHEFSAWMTYEVGKPWVEADADTAEAIDFLEYYARQMVSLKDGVEVNSREIEHNSFSYIPLGVGITISPWNLALAIMCGTASGPVVAGNTILLKPAKTATVISYKFMEVLLESGLPDGVVNWVPGSSAEIGDYLVDHPKTRFINFTGSKATGLHIAERAAKVQPGQIWMKRVITEMGGKDTIIVDDDADLELATDAIAYSAFGFSGQKCSACSRVIAHEDVYDELLDKVAKKAETLTVGPTNFDNSNFMGAVNDEEAFKKIMGYVEVGKQEGRLVTGGTGDDSKGYFIQPTIFADLDPEARIMQEEVFGPFVGFAKAKDFDELIDIANNTEYGLTGAVISNNRANLEKARADFHVGNLYFNRGCTAAIVGYQPFGGFNMSGTDSKAGGPDYLLHFLQPKTVTDQFKPTV